MWPTFADQNPHLAIIGRAVSSCQIFTLPCVSANLTTRSWSQSTSQYSFIETLHGEEWNWTGAKLETALLLLLSRSALLSSRSSLFIIIKMRSLTRVAWTRQGSRSVPDISFFSSPTAAHRNVKMSTQAGIYPISSNFPFSKHEYMSKVFVFKLKYSFMCYLCMSSVRSQPRITKYASSTLKQRDWVLFYKKKTSKLHLLFVVSDYVEIYLEHRCVVPVSTLGIRMKPWSIFKAEYEQTMKQVWDAGRAINCNFYA